MCFAPRSPGSPDVDNALEGSAYVQAPLYVYGSFHARHNGSGSVLWADGHVSTERPKVLRTIYPAGNRPADRVKKLTLGDVDRDGNPSTDELKNRLRHQPPLRQAHPVLPAPAEPSEGLPAEAGAPAR